MRRAALYLTVLLVVGSAVTACASKEPEAPSGCDELFELSDGFLVILEDGMAPESIEEIEAIAGRIDLLDTEAEVTVASRALADNMVTFAASMRPGAVGEAADDLDAAQEAVLESMDAAFAICGFVLPFG